MGATYNQEERICMGNSYIVVLNPVSPTLLQEWELKAFFTYSGEGRVIESKINVIMKYVG